MKKIVTAMSTSAIILLVAFVIGMALSDATLAQADESQTNESAETKTSEKTENYTYIAQPGDSYSQMARKAVQTYGIETNSQIGGAGVLFAETNLTSMAGWPELNEGQTVTISKASVKEWFEKAGQLSADQKAEWNYYVQFVDFNTNGVGEALKN